MLFIDEGLQGLRELTECHLHFIFKAIAIAFDFNFNSL